MPDKSTIYHSNIRRRSIFYLFLQILQTSNNKKQITIPPKQNTHFPFLQRDSQRTDPTPHQQQKTIQIIIIHQSNRQIHQIIYLFLNHFQRIQFLPHPGISSSYTDGYGDWYLREGFQWWWIIWSHCYLSH